MKRLTAGITAWFVLALPLSASTQGMIRIVHIEF